MKYLLHSLHPALEDGTDRGFRNVGKPQSDAGEIPKRIHTMGVIVGELDPCRKLTLLKTEETRLVLKPKLRRLGSDAEGLKNKGLRNWRRKSQARELWRTILEESTVHQEL